MKKIALYALTTVILMMSSLTFAVEENTVVELPPVEAIINPNPAKAPTYGPDGLIGYYWDGQGEMVDEQFPSLTEEEQQRAEVQLSQYDKGARPNQSLLDVKENVVVGVYGLNPEDYDGEKVYVLLPGIPLTDDQLLGIIDAYAQLGLPFRSDGLNYRNCARGGGMNSTRFLIPEETERKDLLKGLFRRQELRPESPLTPLPGDDGVGQVMVNSKLYAGLKTFRFIPYRKTRDEELLTFIASQINGEVSSSQYAVYEKQARSALKRLVNAPLALELIDESLSIGSQQNVILGEDPVYSASFNVLSADFPFQTYYIMLDAQIGTCKWLYTHTVVSDMAQSDVWFDSNGTQLAKQAQNFVEKIRMDDTKFNHVDFLGESKRSDVDTCLIVRIHMDDGGYYNLLIAVQNSEVIDMEYINQLTSIGASEKK